MPRPASARTRKSSPNAIPLLEISCAWQPVNFERRREIILSGINAEAKRVGGSVVDAGALLDEVSALVEWPVPITGSFDEKYLELPREVVISTLTSHQRYFAIADKNGDLLPNFITVANLDSKDPDQVRDGNERVIRPRLADAAFFWDSDRRTGLAARQDALREVVYQRGLGSLFDKAMRTANLAAEIGHIQIRGLSVLSIWTQWLGHFGLAMIIF